MIADHTVLIQVGNRYDKHISIYSINDFAFHLESNTFCCWYMIQTVLFRLCSFSFYHFI